MWHSLWCFVAGVRTILLPPRTEACRPRRGHSTRGSGGAGARPALRFDGFRKDRLRRSARRWVEPHAPPALGTMLTLAPRHSHRQWITGAAISSCSGVLVG